MSLNWYDKFPFHAYFSIFSNIVISGYKLSAPSTVAVINENFQCQLILHSSTSCTTFCNAACIRVIGRTSHSTVDTLATF